jgi:hypothetical protein
VLALSACENPTTFFAFNERTPQSSVIYFRFSHYFLLIAASRVATALISGRSRDVFCELITVPEAKSE